jgi:excisionase family DNA binding protein
MTTNETQPKKSPLLPKGVYTEPKYLRPSEAAVRISATPAFIYKLLKNGSLRSHKLGKARLIKATDIDQLVEGNA